ncbi:MAG: hypothetical protein M1118_03425 [Chloroflexi bacterium]|nr:hypothetical protein [Chloroflexota bacterium]
MSTARLERVRDHLFFRSFRITKPCLKAGDQQTIRVSIKNPVQEVVVLSAVVTYPNGSVENFAAATITGRGELRWVVPPGMPSGSALVVLSAGSGGCCGSDLRKRHFGTLGPVEASFEVQAVS